MPIWPNVWNSKDAVEAAFWLSACALAYAYVGYPVLLLMIAPFFRRTRAEPGYTPTITMIIAAHNEEESIGRKLRETFALEYPRHRFEVIVVSDGSTDATDAIVEAWPEPRLRLLRIPQHRGKTYAQNQAVAMATGEIVVFSDATAVYHPRSLLYLMANYRDPHVGAVSGPYRYFDPSGASPTGIGTIAFWDYENLVKKLQSRICTLTGSSGCIYSVRKELYQPLPDDACSDLLEPLCILKTNHRVVFEDRAMAYEETTQTSSDEFAMRVRVVSRGIRGILSAAELLNFWRHRWIFFQLLSHKILRWAVALFLVVTFVTAAVLADQPGFRLILLLQLAFYSTAVLGAVLPRSRWTKVLGVPLYFCTLNAAVLVSVFRLIQGHKFVVWQPVRKPSGIAPREGARRAGGAAD